MARLVSLSAPDSLWAVLIPAVPESFSLVVFAALCTILVLLVAIFQYVQRLNHRHARLLADLEHELAVRRRIEEALRKSEGFYHSLVESLPQSILRKDLEGRFTFANQRFCTALERPLDRIVGTTDFDYFPNDLAEKYRRDDKTVMESGQVFETVEKHVTPHGETLYVHVIKTPLHDTLGRLIGVQGIFWDVTAAKRAEEQLKTQNERLQEMARSEREAHVALKQTQSRLVEQEKLAGLGQVAAGVAHEINNPVSFVTNNVAVLKRDVGEMYELLTMYREADDLIARERPELAARIAELCDRVDMDYTLKNIEGLLLRSRDGLKRIQEIVAHLRAFVHLDEGEVNEADLNSGVESTAAIILGHARRKHITLEMDLQPLPPVTCSAAKINQVIMNLFTNAIDACSEGGVVTVRTRPEEQGVRIEVCDNGCGMSQAVRERIFEPFYTTKPVGAGTGLGLSISYGIIQDHGGSIEVESTPGRGTCFIVHVPLRRTKPRKEGEPRPDGNGPIGREPEQAART
ncbi:MAG: ATP-binding protein [Isosphaeraceae bacterium]|nr:ATP-binding protein [Isosphaeraceae bacterium]